MTLFEHALLSNVVWAAALAAGAALITRFFATRSRRATALLHGLWVLVLLRLIIPPAVYLAYTVAPVPLSAKAPDAVAAVAPIKPRVSAGTITTADSKGDRSAQPIRSSVSPATPQPTDLLPSPAFATAVAEPRSENPSLAAPRKASRPATSPTIAAPNRQTPSTPGVSPHSSSGASERSSARRPSSSR